MRFELLDPRYCLSTVAFVPHTIFEESNAHTRIVDSMLADLDDDSDLDVIAVYHGREARVDWHENLGGGAFGDARIIVPARPGLGLVTTVGDLDGDGDADIVAAIGGVPSEILWYNNTNGKGQFDEEQFAQAVSTSIRSLFITDVNGDGQSDILSATNGRNADFTFNNSIVWYEHRLTGDANDDGVFDSLDLVAVLASGKYESSDHDVTFDEGDWNQDGRFTSEDLIYALAAGHYQSK